MRPRGIENDIPGSGGFDSSIALSASRPPVGTTASFNSSTIAAPGGGSSTMTLTVGLSMAVGTYPHYGDGDWGRRPADHHCHPHGHGNHKFRPFRSPTIQTIARGTSGTYTVTVTGSPGFSGTVTLSLGGLPPKTTASFNRISVTSSGSSTLTLQVGSKGPRGNSTLTIKETSGSLVQSWSATLTVK